ncbi:MAG TPA: hypothetical protein VIH85_28160 [Solirubrobacteraceae bacterium]|jgi:hypothetical protein
MSDNSMRGLGRAMFAAILLIIGGVLGVIYGIAAISNSHFFVNDTKFVFSDLKTWGWVVLILGILELIAAFSLIRGGAFGRLFGILIGSLNAIGALLSIAAYPLLSIALFALSIWIVYGLAIYDPSDTVPDVPRSRPATPTNRVTEGSPR